MRITNALMNETEQPTDTTVKAALGAAGAQFDSLKTLTSDCEHEWRHYGKKYGWKLRVHAEDKVLFELTVSEGFFLIAMSLREQERKAFEADAALKQNATADGFLKFEVRDDASAQPATAVVRFLMAQRELA
jgi:hypothetical protein